jgi:hypothetical protein
MRHRHTGFVHSEMRGRNPLRLLALSSPLVLAVLGNAAFADISGPDVSSPNPQQLRSEEAGSFAVNDHTGAAAYAYSFQLPPARGSSPLLSLTYTSNGAIRGDIAQGFSLGPVPVIRRDVQREAVICGANCAIVSKQYTAFMGGAIHQLVEVSGDATYLPPGASSATTYRAQIDNDFTRFVQITVPQNELTRTYWVALTTDGRTFYFGDDYFADSSVDHASTAFGEEYYLSHITDRWGNTITYQYTAVIDSVDGLTEVDRVLSSIYYNANATSGVNLQDHARVRINWTTPSTCAISPTGGRHKRQLKELHSA